MTDDWVRVDDDVTAWELFWAGILAGPPLADPLADAMDGDEWELDLDGFGTVTS